MAGNARDSLGNRVKGYESHETERCAMRGTPLVIRVDGRSFSKFTRGMQRPYDQSMADLMVEVASYLLVQVNAKVAFTQSDEISLILEPFSQVGPSETRNMVSSVSAALNNGNAAMAFGQLDVVASRINRGLSLIHDDTQFMFGGRFQKLCSVIAGLATARFMLGAVSLWPDRVSRQLPVFDARVFPVPNRDEAVAALVWRELDATKNAVGMAARAYFPHSRLQGKSSVDMRDMLLREHGVDFDGYPARFRRGVYLQRLAVMRDIPPERLARVREGNRPKGPVLRSEVVCLDLPPIMTLSNRVEVLLDGVAPRQVASLAGGA